MQHEHDDTDAVTAITTRWLHYAMEDLTEAEAMVRRPDYAPRHACFLAQQGAEKALKAVLVFLQIDVPRSHNLNALRNLIPSAWPLTQQYLDLTDLTEWAVEARYPGDWPDPTTAQAEEAVRQARALYDAVQRDLTAHGFEEQMERNR